MLQSGLWDKGLCLRIKIDNFRLVDSLLQPFGKVGQFLIGDFSFKMIGVLEGLGGGDGWRKTTWFKARQMCRG